MGLTYAHLAGVPIYQGGLCGGKLALGNGMTSPWNGGHYPTTSYFVAGSRTSTTVDYIIVYNGGQNGNIPIKVPSVSQVTLNNLTRAGNVVTATVVSGTTYPYNGYAAPSAASVVVSGASPSDLNGTITGTHANTAGMTWNQTGADETGSGGTLSVTGLNNYFIYCGAETVRVMGVSVNTDHTPALDGTLQVEPNNCQWTPGEAVAQPNHYSIQAGAAEFQVMDGFTPPVAQANNVNQIIMGGMAWSGGVEHLSATTDLLSSMSGFGGNIVPRTFLSSSNYYGIMFNLATPPLNGGSIFNIACPAEGCVSTAYPYRLFELSGVPGTSLFQFNPADGTFNTNTGLYSQTYTAGRTAIGIGGIPGLTGAPIVAPGTAGFGGYFTGIGEPNSSSSNDTLCLGTGALGDCSGTLGAAKVISPDITAGVNAPIAVGVFVAGTTGSTTYTYACTAVTTNGETTAVTGTTNLGNATLSVTNYNHPKCYGVPGATSLNIYRTVGGASQGLIGNEPNSAENSGIPFNDTGLTANPAIMPPTANTTGKMTVKGMTTTTNLTVTGTCTGCGSGSALPSGTTNQMLYYAAPGTTVTPLSLGTNLSITSGVLNASATAATNFNALTSGTNTAAAMTVGSGASLGTTGTGTITATGMIGTLPAANGGTYAPTSLDASQYTSGSTTCGIQEAINALPFALATGGTVRFHGHCTTATTITIRNGSGPFGITLQGDGPEASVIGYTGTGDAIKIGSSTVDTKLVTIRDLNISTNSPTANAIDAIRTKHLGVINVACDAGGTSSNDCE
jgi:hypothetical protein